MRSLVLAVLHAVAFEGGFHFVQLVVEGARRSGVGVLLPEVLPFRTAPLFEAVACGAAAVALVLEQEAACALSGPNHARVSAANMTALAKKSINPRLGVARRSRSRPRPLQLMHRI